MPPSVTMSDGTPNAMTRASTNVTSMPKATAATMPTASGIPWMTTNVPATAAQTPGQRRRRQVDLADEQDEDDAERRGSRS